MWKEYQVTDIFTVKNTHNILSSWIIPNSGSIPYVTAGQDNNSISSYVDYDKTMMDEGNSIFIGGKTLVISYQPNNYFSNDSHNLALYLKNGNREKENQLFITSCLYKTLSPKYSWGNSISSKKIQSDIVYLPSKNGIISHDFMSDFIKVIEKIVIKDLVEWTDKKIAATKEVVAK